MKYIVPNVQALATRKKQIKYLSSRFKCRLTYCLIRSILFIREMSSNRNGLPFSVTDFRLSADDKCVHCCKASST